jgi:hypothetical protein
MDYPESVVKRVAFMAAERRAPVDALVLLSSHI